MSKPIKIPTKKLPPFVKGVLALLNLLHWKVPQVYFNEIGLIGYATDACTASGFDVSFKWNEKKEEYEAYKIPK